MSRVNRPQPKTELSDLAKCVQVVGSTPAGRTVLDYLYSRWGGDIDESVEFKTFIRVGERRVVDDLQTLERAT